MPPPLANGSRRRGPTHRLAEDDEDGVHQLGHLGEDEKHHPHAAGALAVRDGRVGADGVLPMV